MATWRDMNLDEIDEFLDSGGTFEMYGSGTKLIVLKSERFGLYVMGGIGNSGTMTSGIGDLQRLMEQYDPSLRGWVAVPPSEASAGGGQGQ